MKKELNQGISMIMEDEGADIFMAIDVYLTKGDTVKYLFPTVESRTKFKKQQLKIYYEKLRADYAHIKIIHDENRDMKTKVRKVLEDLKNVSS